MPAAPACGSADPLTCGVRENTCPLQALREQLLESRRDNVTLVETNKELQAQLGVYGSRFSEFQSSITKSNQVGQRLGLIGHEGLSSKRQGAPSVQRRCPCTARRGRASSLAHSLAHRPHLCCHPPCAVLFRRLRSSRRTLTLAPRPGKGWWWRGTSSSRRCARPGPAEGYVRRIALLSRRPAAATREERASALELQTSLNCKQAMRASSP